MTTEILEVMKTNLDTLITLTLGHIHLRYNKRVILPEDRAAHYSDTLSSKEIIPPALLKEW